MSLSNDVEISSRLDLAFANFLSQRTTFEDTDKKHFATLLTSLSLQQRNGHTCIEISADDKALLLSSGFACHASKDGIQSYPLIIEDNRLYLQRCWVYEDRLAKQINRLAQKRYETNDLGILLGRYFTQSSIETDWQREAASLACQRAFSIITGGPGTGKTTTVCKILALLQELAEKPLLMALAAPTGKAAMRLQEAIVHNLSLLDCPQRIKESVPQSAATLHRLLGTNPPSPYFKHDADNPLPYNVVIVDEASMVDLALMSKLVDSLKPSARLILLGDKDQLSSVESGAVLADLIVGLPHNTVELTQSYRFDEGIKKLADAVNRQDHETAWVLLSADDGLGLIEPMQLMPYILEKRQEYLRLVKDHADFAEIYREFNRFQVLCSNRYGINGALAINSAVEQSLFARYRHYGYDNWYPGRPVMVTQNNPALHLYNGDIGICLPDHEQGDDLMVFFQRHNGGFKKLLPMRVPNCETVFAMTIHKAQGSEFDEALIVLPPTVNPVLSKELVYTAITRAKKNVKITAEKSVFTAALEKKIGRVTGLAAKLNRL